MNTGRHARLAPPVTLVGFHRRHRWVAPVAGCVFVVLAIGARLGWLFWDPPITRAAVGARTPVNVEIARRVSFLGSTKVVVTVALVAALVAVWRSRRLAVAILVIAGVRPLVEWTIKELVARPRPPEVDRLVTGTGYSFPSGHPLAFAASWCLIPLVVELYTRRVAVWWAMVAAVWTLALGVAWSRVWLGVHYTSDVVAALLLALLGVLAAEHVMHRAAVRVVPLHHWHRGDRTGSVDRHDLGAMVFASNDPDPARFHPEVRGEHAAQLAVRLALGGGCRDAYSQDAVGLTGHLAAAGSG